MQCEAAIPAYRHVRSFLALCLAALVALFGCLACKALLLPSAPGSTVYEKSGTTVDASHADLGYIMVKQKASDSRYKLRISLGDYQLTYDLNNDGEYEVFPLQLGDGKYKVQVFKNISGKRYSTVSSISFKAKLMSDILPFMYPNKFVNYTADTLAIAKANELCAGLSTGRQKYEAVYSYIVDNYTYNYDRAETVQSGYLPDLDEVYEAKSGICFDLSALMACMLRSQDVPTQLVIGYADKSYHAWNLVYLDDDWLRCDPTSEIYGATVSSYTTERMY